MANWKIEYLYNGSYITDTLFGTRSSGGTNNGYIPTPGQNEIDKQIISNGKIVDLANGNQAYVTLSYNKKVQPFTFEISECTDRDESLAIYNAIIYRIENNNKIRITTHDYNTNKLASAITNGATSLTCYNVIAFKSSGKVTVNNVDITYSARDLTGHTLTCSAISGAHAKESVVKQYITMEGYFADVAKKYVFSGKNQLYKLAITFNRTA